MPGRAHAPNLDPHEGILGQAAAGIAHITVAPDGTLVADDPDLVSPASADAAHDLPAAAFAPRSPSSTPWPPPRAGPPS